MSRLTLQEWIKQMESVIGADELANYMFREEIAKGIMKPVSLETINERKQRLEWLKELQHYKDLEEQGRLIELPCKVGDTLWRAFGGIVEAFVVKEFKIQAYMFDRVEIYFRNASGFGLCLFDGTLDEYWYKTKEEAEAKLAELKGEGNV